MNERAATDAADPQQIPDDVVLVDRNDVPIGTTSKKAAHLAPGQRHRAFSVSRPRRGRQVAASAQRARSKYHFGGRWTNACCSHPRPNEALLDAAGASPRPGDGPDRSAPARRRPLRVPGRRRRFGPRRTRDRSRGDRLVPRAAPTRSRRSRRLRVGSRGRTARAVEDEGGPLHPVVRAGVAAAAEREPWLFDPCEPSTTLRRR